jgi:hypothetical protein
MESHGGADDFGGATVTTATRTDLREVSLTKRQWHLVVNELGNLAGVSDADAAILRRASAYIADECDKVRSLDDIVRVTASVSGLLVVASVCNQRVALRWNVYDDLVRQIGADQHGG